MEQRLILMRHATADSDDGRDHARKLTEGGIDEAHRVGRWLASKGRVPDRILSSSAFRCRETCQALLAGLGHEIKIEVDFDDRLYNAPAEVLLDTLTGLAEMAGADSPDGETVLLLAHNPGISHLAFELADTASDTTILRSGFSPAAIACFETDSSWSMLSRGASRLVCFRLASEF